MKDILWTIYLIVMIWLTYDLISSSISRIVRKVLDTDITHLLIVSIQWGIWYMYFLH